jgi:hypothetical protein
VGKGGAKLREDFTFEQNDREFMKINPKNLKMRIAESSQQFSF